jgi:hypothetical protein
MNDIPEPYVLARRGLPLAAPTRAVLRGRWLPAASRNPAAIAPELPPPEQAEVADDSAWWLEAADWLPSGAADADSMQPIAGLAAPIAPSPVAPSGHAPAVRSVREPTSVQHDAAEPREASRANQPHWQANAQTDIAPQAVMDSLSADEIDPGTPGAAAPAYPLRPAAMQAIADTAGVAPPPRVRNGERLPPAALTAAAGAPRSPPPGGGRTSNPASGTVAADDSGDAARQSSTPATAPIRPPRPAVIDLPAMGLPSPLGPVRGPSAPVDLTALLAPRPRAGAEVRIDRVSVTVQAGPQAAPQAPVPAPGAAPAAGPVRTFRNPWAGYHSRLD